ncbi:blue light-inducible protein Bli-3 [Pyrenochaeta sp. MPI-SDFR-AT-0127]|nr:blue light-inducible protein Bli-3 [Pyrenochaeta sp. MPI-SDFR-AT-0127]
MPETLHASEVNSKTDPSVAKQYDDETPRDQHVEQFFDMVDERKICMLNTYRKGVGPVGRSMAVAKRSGPDFLFLANKHSTKISDLDQNKEVQISVQDSKTTQNWISISGMATTTSNTDPHLGDNTHTGGPEDPRMTLIEVKSKYVTYYQSDVGLLGYAKEVVGAAMTGGVANTGKLRELNEQDRQQARTMQ